MDLEHFLRNAEKNRVPGFRIGIVDNPGNTQALPLPAKRRKRIREHFSTGPRRPRRRRPDGRGGGPADRKFDAGQGSTSPDSGEETGRLWQGCIRVPERRRAAFRAADPPGIAAPVPTVSAGLWPVKRRRFPSQSGAAAAGGTKTGADVGNPGRNFLKNFIGGAGFSGNVCYNGRQYNFSVYGGANDELPKECCCADGGGCPPGYI